MLGPLLFAHTLNYEVAIENWLYYIVNNKIIQKQNSKLCIGTYKLYL